MLVWKPPSRALGSCTCSRASASVFVNPLLDDSDGTGERRGESGKEALAEEETGRRSEEEDSPPFNLGTRMGEAHRLPDAVVLFVQVSLSLSVYVSHSNRRVSRKEGRLFSAVFRLLRGSLYCVFSSGAPTKPLCLGVWT